MQLREAHANPEGLACAFCYGVQHVSDFPLSQLERDIISAFRSRASRLDDTVATWEFRLTHYADGSMIASLVDTGVLRVTPDHKFQECNK